MVPTCPDETGLIRREILGASLREAMDGERRVKKLPAAAEQVGRDEPFELARLAKPVAKCNRCDGPLGEPD